MNNSGYNYDADFDFKDAGLVAASAAAQVDAADKIVDLGAAYMKFSVVVDVTAVEIASNDERYDIVLQLSNSATFASVFVDRASIPVGAHEALAGDTDSVVGRHVLHVDNELAGTIYRYARLYTVVAGTIATGINYTAFASPL